MYATAPQQNIKAVIQEEDEDRLISLYEKKIHELKQRQQIRKELQEIKKKSTRKRFDSQGDLQVQKARTASTWKQTEYHEDTDTKGSNLAPFSPSIIDHIKIEEDASQINEPSPLENHIQVPDFADDNSQVTREQYDTQMAKIWSSDGPSVEDIQKQNANLLARASDKISHQKDTRSLVRKILSQDPYYTKKYDKSKVFREAIKYSIKPSEYWADKPTGFKGNKFQWVQYQQQMKTAQKAQQMGKKKKELYKQNVNEQFKLKSEAFKKAGQLYDRDVSIYSKIHTKQGKKMMDQFVQGLKLQLQGKSPNGQKAAQEAPKPVFDLQAKFKDLMIRQKAQV